MVSAKQIIVHYNLKVFHKGLILVGLPVVLNCVIVGTLFWLVLQADKEHLNEVRNTQILQQYIRAGSLISGATFTLHKLSRGFNPELFMQLRDITHEFIKTRKKLFILVEKEQDPILRKKYRDSLLASNPLLRYAPLLDKFMKGSTYKPTHEDSSNAKLSCDQISSSYRTVVEETEKYLEESPGKQAFIRQMQFTVLVSGMLLNIILAFFLAKYFTKGIVNRLQVMTDNSRRLANDEPLNPLLSGHDEIAKLDVDFHNMAAALADAAQKERTAFDNASDVICVLNPEGIFSRVNAACVRLWGRKPETLTGTSIIDLTLSSDRENTRQSLASTQKNEPSAEFESQIRHGDGHTISLLWSIYWSQVENAIFCVAHDISEQKHIENMKRQFLSLVSHDLRRPLTSIYQTLQQLASHTFGKLPEEATVKLNQTISKINRLAVLVDDLLNIEKMKDGKLDLERREVPVSDLLQRAVQEIEHLATQHNITIITKSSAGLFSLDSDRMMQVLVNLLSNAVKFSPQGSTITLASRLYDNKLELTVTDQGRGVPSAKRESIFERFSQVETADGLRGFGTGLGLPICKQIVELHNGKIGVDSESGKGSTFWITIPESQEPPSTTLNKPLQKAEQIENIDPHPSLKTPPVKRIMFSRLTLAQKGYILVGMPVLIGIIFTVSLGFSLIQADQETAKEQYKRKTILTAGKLSLTIYETANIVLYHPTPEQWPKFKQGVQEVFQAQTDLQELTKDNHTLSQPLSQIERGANGLKIHLVDRAEDIVKTRGNTQAALEKAFSSSLRQELLPILTDLALGVNELASIVTQTTADHPKRLEQLRSAQGKILLYALIFSVVTSVTLSIFFSKNITKRLKILQDNSRRLTEGLSLNPPLAGEDEITQLDHVFHLMARTLQEARRKESAVFDNTQDVICSFDSNTKFRWVSPACLKLWGYSADELLMLSIKDIVLTEDLDASISALIKSKTESRALTFENRVQSKDGQVRDMLWSVSWSEPEQTLFATIHDISKRKELERIKQEVLAMVSHDLRTPLTVIQGVAHLMLIGAYGELPAAAIQPLEEANKDTKRLIHLVNDLLDLEKFESGQMFLIKQPVSISDLVEQTCQSVNDLAEHKRIALSVHTENGTVLIDAGRIQQVLVSLLTSAIKVSPEGSTIGIAAAVRTNELEIRVSDHGPGIPEATKAEIFERYKQFSKSDQANTFGTDMSMPICKYIIEAHEGTIGILSEADPGNTFWFKLPNVRDLPA